MSLVFGPQQKIVLIGDSITDCGRRNEPFAPYGAGYVKFVRALLLARYPELGLEVVNRGIGGNTVRDLARRWDEDVIAEQPDWLSVKIGINDVWRTMTGRHDGGGAPGGVPRHLPRLAGAHPTGDAGPPDPDGAVRDRPAGGGRRAGRGRCRCRRRRRRYPELRQQNVATGPELEAVMRHFRALMDEYIGAVRELAAEFGALLVPTQGAFDEVLDRQPPVFWAADRVHPGAPGHAVIARAFLRTAGYGDV